MQRRQVPQPFSAYNDSPLISFMGLNGLSLILPNAKQEIEIQKVVEASFGSIVGMLSKKYIIPVGIPEPRGYYFMNKWLEGFAYKMNPGRVCSSS